MSNKMNNLKSSLDCINAAFDHANTVYEGFDKDSRLVRTLTNFNYETQASEIRQLAEKLCDKLSDLEEYIDMDMADVEETRLAALAKLTDEEKEILGLK